MELTQFLTHIPAIQRGFTVGNTLCELAGLTVHCTISNMRLDQSVVSFSEWLNLALAEKVGFIDGKVKTRAPWLSIAKTAELVMPAALSGLRLRKTPEIEKTNGGCGFMGGIRHQDWAVSVSKMRSGAQDALLALIVLNAIHDPYCRVHHVGFRYGTEVEYLIAKEGHANLGEQFVCDTTNPTFHFRTFTYVGNDVFGNPMFIEDQYFPDGPHDKATHLDVVTEEPIRLLNWAEWLLETNAQRFQNMQPIGAIFVNGEPGDSPLGLMPRSAKDVWDPRN